MIKKAIGGILIFGLLGIVVMFFIRDGATDNKTNIEFIKSHCYNNKIIDMQNEISIKSSDDVKWYYDKGDSIVIEYGKILLKYKTKDFVTDDVQKDMNDIFISVKQNPESLELYVYFQDELLPEYIKR